MSPKKFLWGFIFSVSLAVATEVIYQVIKRKKQPKKTTVIQKKEIHEVILFAYSDKITKKSNFTRCLITPSLERLLFYLDSAQTSLDICIYVFTNTDISNVIVRMKKRGVQIRVLIDADMAYSSGSQMRRLEKHKIPVRWLKSTNLMHHKFCIIDAYCDNSVPYVMTGSLNWTTQALSGNWEDVVVTSQPEIVKSYSYEYERLWEKFKAVTIM